MTMLFDQSTPYPFIPAKAGIHSQALGPRFRGDERLACAVPGETKR